MLQDGIRRIPLLVSRVLLRLSLSLCLRLGLLLLLLLLRLLLIHRSILRSARRVGILRRVHGQGRQGCVCVSTLLMREQGYAMAEGAASEWLADCQALIGGNGGVQTVLGQ